MTTRSDIERCGSHPNLSSVGASASLRKRKHPDESDVQSQLKDIQSQITTMMEMLTLSINTQKENASNIKSDIEIIKKEMLDIKTGMGLTEEKINRIVSEQTNIKEEIKCLTNSVKSADTKINCLETDMHNLRLSSKEMENFPNNIPFEKILTEINEQSSRKNNLIVMGLQESACSDYKDRLEFDRKEAIKVIGKIVENSPEPSKVQRVGRYKPDTCRSVKVCFESEKIVKLILKNRNKLTDSHIKVFPDQTPYQQTFFKKVKDELNRRCASGENNLTIKYIKGVPQIVSTFSKNCQK